LNTLHLKQVVEVEKAGSISKAAKKLYMNQPSLSKTIRELEESIGFELFKRTNNGMAPTKRGSEFLTLAKGIIFEVEKLENMLDNSPKSYFNITVPRASYISSAFTEFIKKTLTNGKKMDIDYRETGSTPAIGNVIGGVSDIGIIRCRENEESFFIDLLQKKKLKYELVRHFEYLVLLSDKHDLASCSVIKGKDLDKYIEITHEDVDTLSEKFSLSRGASGRISIYERGSQFEILKRVPVTFMWASPTPWDVLDTFSLVQRRTDVARNMLKDFLIYRYDYKLSDEDKSFVKKLRESVENTETH
jgi:DNA-binding transcriptional LysR family regulator